MANHLHLVLRTLPRVAKRWSPLEVARRWLTITKLAKCMSDAMPTPDRKRVEQLAKNKKEIARLRKRLSCVSWFIGTLCENIARRANKEDDCLGRFWESRYKCRECVSDGGILLCGIYVDLNPEKAGEASSPETARLIADLPPLGSSLRTRLISTMPAHQELSKTRVSDFDPLDLIGRHGRTAGLRAAPC